MTNRAMTFEEIKDALRNCSDSVLTSAVEGGRKAVANVRGQARRNCTPGKSPYDDMWFPTKQVKATKYGMPYTGAPYSYDRDPARDPIHMRDAMYSRVILINGVIHCIVGNPKPYAGEVHEGNSQMWPRPFIWDAIKEKDAETRAILTEAIQLGLLRACEGDIFPETPSDYPTLEEGDEE